MVGLVDQIERGEVNLREALGLDLSVLQLLVDKAFALIGGGRAIEGEALLADLTRVVNLSYTLPFALGAARETRRDWFGAREAYSLALSRGTNAPPAFQEEASAAMKRTEKEIAR